MARNGIPKYGYHKGSGQARVLIGGRHIYLGRYGSPESREAYARAIAEAAALPTASASPPQGGCRPIAWLSTTTTIQHFTEDYSDLDHDDKLIGAIRGFSLDARSACHPQRPSVHAAASFAVRLT